MELLLVFLLIWLVLWLTPVAILIFMAKSKGRSLHFAWWAVFLGWIGFLVAAIIIAAGADPRAGVTR